jgi:hypothetical protein
MWYDRKVDTRYPANVLSGFEPSAGATFFNLNQLQVCGGGGGEAGTGPAVCESRNCCKPVGCLAWELWELWHPVVRGGLQRRCGPSMQGTDGSDSYGLAMIAWDV